MTDAHAGAPGVTGIDQAALHHEIRPQDDLFRHVNQTWIDDTEIPADRARWGSFDMLRDEAEQAVMAIVRGMADRDDAAGEDAKIAQLWKSFMDVERLEALGVEPLSEPLAHLDAVSSIEEFLVWLGQADSQGGPGFVGMYVDADLGDPDHYAMYWNQGGLGLPDESYYRDEAFERERTEYRAYIERMLGFLGERGHCGYASAGEAADAIYALEEELAKHHWNKVDARDLSKAYNVQAVLEEYPFLAPYLEHIEGAHGIFEKVIVGQPSFFAALEGLLTEERLEAWKAWATLGVLRAASPYLTPEISKANFDLYGTVLTGATEQRSREKRGVAFVEGAMGEAIGRAYVAEHFPPEARERMDDLIQNLIKAYDASIRDLPWMGEATKQEALTKLAHFKPMVGAPEKWRDYSGLEVSDELIANVRAANRHEHLYELGKVGQPVDFTEWAMFPQTVNAYYHPSRNQIVFPAAILQPPFFSPEWDDATIYAAIGAVIGHEIGHGFDDQGSKVDGRGELRDWWTAEDRAAFEDRTRALIEQYNQLSPTGAPHLNVNGELTVGENIGDLGGLGIAWKAYKLSLDGAEPPVVDGLTAQQRFAYAWAQIWKQKARPEEAARLVQIDPHSPAEHRANQVLRNMDLFYEAFDVQPGDAMYLAPEDRVTIW